MPNQAPVATGFTINAWVQNSITLPLSSYVSDDTTDFSQMTVEIEWTGAYMTTFPNINFDDVATIDQNSFEVRLKEPSFWWQLTLRYRVKDKDGVYSNWADIIINDIVG